MDLEQLSFKVGYRGASEKYLTNPYTQYTLHPYTIHLYTCTPIQTYTYSIIILLHYLYGFEEN
jgi:hypothetical protein